MFVRPTNPVSHRLARMAFITACVAALVVASAGPLHRFAGLDVEADFTASLSAGQWITATATDATGNTSAFSQAIPV